MEVELRSVEAAKENEFGMVSVPNLKVNDVAGDECCALGIDESCSHKTRVRHTKLPPDYLWLGIVLCFICPPSGILLIIYTPAAYVYNAVVMSVLGPTIGMILILLSLKSRKSMKCKDARKAWKYSNFCIYAFTFGMTVLLVCCAASFIQIWMNFLNRDSKRAFDEVESEFTKGAAGEQAKLNHNNNNQHELSASGDQAEMELVLKKAEQQFKEWAKSGAVQVNSNLKSSKEMRREFLLPGHNDEL